jgi:hypothetical protein
MTASLSASNHGSPKNAPVEIAETPSGASTLSHGSQPSTSSSVAEDVAGYGQRHLTEDRRERALRLGLHRWPLQPMPVIESADLGWIRHQLECFLAFGELTPSKKALAAARLVGIVLPDPRPEVRGADDQPVQLERGKLTATLVAKKLRPALEATRTALKKNRGLEAAQRELQQALDLAARLPRGLGSKYARLHSDGRHAMTRVMARLA